ncbi:MAG TPA: glycosyltransferase, partial [Phycisphaerae bacterium]|nr:glycosyltransferase [Phycisphaerae bacterium]
VGTATRAITELIADKHNGLLARPKEPRALASRLLTAIEDQELRRRVIETARGQAYEVFSVRSFVENCERVYANALGGQSAGEGVRDNAFVA